MQAIFTKNLPATRSQGYRIKATSTGGHSVTVDRYEVGGEYEAAHAAAARQLAAKLRWTGKWVGGARPENTGGGFVFVCVDSPDAFTV